MSNDDNMKNLVQKIACGVLIAGTLSLVRCDSSNSYLNNQKEENNVTYDTGEHMLLEIKRSKAFMGKSGRYSFTAPKGYRIIDYDYDFSIGGEDDPNYHYDDFVYVNTEPVFAVSSNSFGEPTDDTIATNNDDNVVEPYQHVLVNIDKSLTFLGKFNETFTLESPVGYTILDYDYDKTGNFNYENITYTNVVPVKIENKKDFGTPTEVIADKIHDDGYYDIGEHLIVEIKNDVNFWLGKDGLQQIEAPVGYRVVDYDYDKSSFLEFETITYCNEVPVVAEKDKFGEPIEEVEVNTHEDGIYEAGEHVLVRIDRNLDLLSGDNGTRQLTAPEGYDLLDYDYDKNSAFEFETYVYVNNTKVSVNDENQFGTIVEKEENVTKKLVP